MLHAIPVREHSADIDHLLIGPGGLFTINAKHHPGARIRVGASTVLVHGHRQAYVPASRHGPARAIWLLSAVCGLGVPVEAVIVTVRVEDVVINQHPGVSMVPRHQITCWILPQRDLHTPEVPKTVYETVRHCTTWR